MFAARITLTHFSSSILICVANFLWCTPNRLEAKRYQVLLYVWQCHALGDLAIEMRDDLARRSGRDEDTDQLSNSMSG